MINYPVLFHRDFRQDFLPPQKKEEEGWQSKCQKVAQAILPFAGLHRPFRTPLSVGMSCLRAYTAESYLQKGYALGNAAVYFLSPSLGFVFSSLNDLANNAGTLVKEARAGHIKEALEAFSFATTDALFIAAFAYGSIYLTTAAMIHQIALECYVTQKHFQNGHYFEGACQALMAGAHIKNVIPQIQVLQWQNTYSPVLTAELKQNEDGFVYLDIPDEYVRTLHEHCGETGTQLPPYFGPGMAGAHVSVILSGEMEKGIKAADIGKKFNFRIVHTDTIKIEGWKGVKGVQFLAIECPELEAVRQRQGIAPRIGGDHDFHITFAIQRSPT